MEFSQPLSGYLTFLVLLLPAIQIYFMASLDALITSFILAYFALVFARKGALYAVIGGLMLTLLSMTTFAFVFVIPPALGYWFYSGRRNNTVLWSFLVFAITHLFIWAATGFSYVESFQIASAFENPNGYRLIAEPANFILTRLEGLFGVFRTGETARAAMFLYPLSIFPIGIAINEFSSWRSNQARFILIALFAQGIAMQFIGDYFW